MATASGKGTRDKAATRSELLAAVARLLARDGFASLGVNAVAREAGVDKVLIYRYFGGMADLLREFGESGGFWPTIEEIVGTGDESLTDLTVADRWATVLARYAEALRRRPVTKEILAWEQIEQNDLTEVLQEVRQRWFVELMTLFAEDRRSTTADLETTVLLLAAGIHYFVVRGRLQDDFSGVAIGSDEGWARLNDVIRTICEQTLKPPEGDAP
ncbi:MAG: TetR/AcrR family transcriptional regulator [Acidimicrobiales bacterium]